MAGYAPISLQQRVDTNGRPYPGAKAFFYEADTLLPITVYQDYSLAVAHPNPVAADAYGVFPAIFLDEADEFYRIRITTASGVILTDLSTLPIIGPSGGGGGSEVPVDANALFKTGDVMWLDQSGTRSGWVRDNGRTIGAATSGASERANSDCESLYTFLWNTYPNTICPVTGDRGVSAAADWAANKPIGTPDKRGRGPKGLDDMGNAAASRFHAQIPFTYGDETTPGALGGQNAAALAQAELPAVSPTFAGTQKTWTLNEGGILSSATAATTVIDAGQSIARLGNLGTATVTVTPAGTISALGSGTTMNKSSMFVLGTFYRKL